VRRVWDYLKDELKDERLLNAIKAAERHADGLLDQKALGLAITEANRARGKYDVTRAVYETVRYRPGGPYEATRLVTDRVSRHVASLVVPAPNSVYGTYVGGIYVARYIRARVPTNPVARQAWLEAENAEFTAQCKIVRDIFASPFRPVANLSHVPPAVITLAQTIYDERTFDQMPELADALEQAGCTDKAILDHCRGPGPHVRGCWLIDLLLGKS